MDKYLRRKIELEARLEIDLPPVTDEDRQWWDFCDTHTEEEIWKQIFIELDEMDRKYAMRAAMK